jgi:hypothetical protein
MSEQQLLKDILNDIKQKHLKTLTAKIIEIKSTYAKRGFQGSMVMQDSLSEAKDCIDNIIEDFMEKIESLKAKLELDKVQTRIETLVDELFREINSILKKDIMKDHSQEDKILEYKNKVIEDIKRKIRIIQNS